MGPVAQQRFAIAATVKSFHHYEKTKGLHGAQSMKLNDSKCLAHYTKFCY